MKKIFYSLLALPMLLMGSCKEEMGTEPGTDPNPAVTLYTYTPADENLNPDNDVTVRFSTNSATREVYYLVEDAAEVDKAIEAGSEDTYIQKVLNSGSKISVNGAESVEVDITGIAGLKYILAVASNGSAGQKLSKIAFRGLEWEYVLDGSLMYGPTFVPQGADATLEICTTDKNLYRIKNAFGEGYHMKFELLADKTGKDEDGEYVLFRVPLQKTPFKVSLSDGTTHDLSVEDVGYWQGNASFVTSETSYCNIFYPADGYAIINLAWMLEDGRCVGYGAMNANTSQFLPNE